jgi:hypothetical protein
VTYRKAVKVAFGKRLSLLAPVPADIGSAAFPAIPG